MQAFLAQGTGQNRSKRNESVLGLVCFEQQNDRLRRVIFGREKTPKQSQSKKSDFLLSVHSLAKDPDSREVAWISFLLSPPQQYMYPRCVSVLEHGVIRQRT